MNSRSNASPPSSGAARWLLKFGFFLALFAVLGLALAYVWQGLGTPKAPADATTQASPSPTASPSAPFSGASGHADRPPSPRP